MTHRFRLRFRFGVILLAWVALVGGLAAQNLEERVVEHTLSNGMKLLLLKRSQSPTVSLNIFVKAGGVDEPIGKSGIAHMLEHMLFKGTKILGTTNYAAEVPLIEKLDELYITYDAERDKEDSDPGRLQELEAQIQELEDQQKQYILSNELDEVLSYHGAEGLNAGTSIDYTTYFMSLPANKLELWMMLESERMRDPVLREFYTERNVVMDEYRRAYVQPERVLWLELLTAAFTAHPYGRPTIGWESDINRLKRPEAAQFFHTYYSPNNAVVAIVGDIDPPKVIEMMTQYFGDIPPQDIPERIKTREPTQKGERRVTVEFDAEPQLLIGYHKPTLPSHEDYVFDMISGILASGRTSRLYKSLVEEKQLAVSVDTDSSVPGARYPNLFVIEAVPRHPHTTAEVEEALYAEMERLKTEPVTDRELEKIRNQMQAYFVRGLNSNDGMASRLGYFELIAGSWKYLTTYTDIIQKITAADIQQVAQTYFTPTNRTVATLVKKAPTNRTGGNTDANGNE